MRFEPNRHTCIDWQGPRLCDDAQLKVKNQGSDPDWEQQMAAKSRSALSEVGS